MRPIWDHHPQEFSTLDTDLCHRAWQPETLSSNLGRAWPWGRVWHQLAASTQKARVLLGVPFNARMPTFQQKWTGLGKWPVDRAGFLSRISLKRLTPNTRTQGHSLSRKKWYILRLGLNEQLGATACQLQDLVHSLGAQGPFQRETTILRDPFSKFVSSPKHRQNLSKRCSWEREVKGVYVPNKALDIWR